ncbi:Sexual development regulator VELC [Lachnellula suecica]|uniref:Sexual development regulator VELC n=1 Tax=Lachnellula suecica TaxID=602035 RepID=A0A8T9CI32_9HELO|nr:Sexual development regulator VELC [Lachnellula suecica]
MSMSEASRAHAPPTPQPGYQYPPRSNENDSTRPPPPTLPPMSSLLSRNERMEEQHNQYPPRQLPGQQDMKHPLWLSEMDPHAPVQHIYPPPLPPTNSRNPHYSPEPLLIPGRSHPSYSQVPAPDPRAPQIQPRQIRRIVQRRPEYAAKGGQGAKSISPTSQDPYQSSQPPSQSASPFQRHSSMSSPAPTQGQSSRSMPISGLLSDPPRQVFSLSLSLANPIYFSTELQRPPVKYSIRMRQEPIAARACGFGERDRRVVDPPPILQMMVEDPHSTAEELSALMRQPCAVVHCTLWDPVANKDDTAMPGTTDKRQQRRLMGTLVSSPFVGMDEHDVEGCFFTFPDLSVRTPGTYSLRFSLMILDPLKMRSGDRVPISSIVYSQSFHVYNAKDFSGMRASTELTKKLKQQGCLISVKKGNAKSSSGGTHPRDDSDDDLADDDDEEDDPDSKGRKPAKRPKR